MGVEKKEFWGERNILTIKGEKEIYWEGEKRKERGRSRKEKREREVT